MKKNTIGIIILIVIGFVFSYLLFKPVFENPNGFLYSKGGDAVKSYFNFSYYLRYDSGIKHDGINYPYGDHLQYINSHPLYVTILKLIDKVFVNTSDFGPGILNLTMILSLILALPFIFLILRKFSLPVWYSVVMTLLILYLTPQFERIHGHFEMVYAFFLPMFWYFLIRYLEDERRVLWGSLLVAGGLIGGFTSAYFVAFYSIFILSVLLVQLWMHRKKFKEFRSQALGLFILAILPLILVRGLVSITDWVNDRPDNPWGFFIFHSTIPSIFMHPMSPLKTLFNNPHFLQYEWEGKAYVGFPAAVLALIIFMSIIYSIFTKDRRKYLEFFPNEKLTLFFVASLFILLFSMCFPFKYGLGFLKDLIPPLKQFRALGRFSWMFYYVFTVYTAWFVYLLFERLKGKGQKFLAFALIILVFGFWAIDAGLNVQKSTRGLLNKNDLLPSSSANFRKMIGEAGIQAQNYQAILFLPFANTCGDKLLFTKGMNSFNQAMSLSYHTGIPLIQSFSPRLSFSHALSGIQMLADSSIRKTRLDDMNDKPILVIQTHEELSPQEKLFLKKSKFLFQNSSFILSEMSPSTINKTYENWKNDALQKISTLNEISPGIFADTQVDMLIHKNYDDQADPFSILSGTGSYYRKKGTFNLLSKEETEKLKEGDFEISFWLFVDTRTDNMPEPSWLKWDDKGKLVESRRLNNREEHNVYNFWVRVDEKVQIQQGYSYALEIKGKYISVDELLVKPLSSTVYVKNVEGLSFFNNFPLID